MGLRSPGHFDRVIAWCEDDESGAAEVADGDGVACRNLAHGVEAWVLDPGVELVNDAGRRRVAGRDFNLSFENTGSAHLIDQRGGCGGKVLPRCSSGDSRR